MVKRRTWLTRALTFLLTISMNVQSVVPAGAYAYAAEDGKAKTEAAVAAEADAGEAVEEETESEAPAKALLSEEMTDASGNETDVPVAEEIYDGDAKAFTNLVIDDADEDLPILHKQPEQLVPKAESIDIEKLYKAKEKDNKPGEYEKSNDLAAVVVDGVTFQLYMATVKDKATQEKTYYIYTAVDKIEGAPDNDFTEARGSAMYNAIKDHANVTFTNVWDGDGRHASLTVPCQTIEKDVFKGKLINYLDIPENITYIKESAFENCTNLNKINFRGEIVGIDKSAFSGCTSLTYANVKDLSKLKTVSDNTFKKCSKFTLDKDGTYEGLPSNITFIGESAFEETNIAKVSVPAKVTFIGKAAFKKCKSLQLLEGCAGVEEFGESSFEECTNLNGDKLPVTNKLRVIGKSAFKGCTSFTNVDLSGASSLITIGHHAFEKCTGINSFVFPEGESLTTIGDYAFNECTSLKCKKVENGGTIQLTIPDTVQNIGSNAFQKCEELKGLKLGSGVICIGSNAFDSSGLMTIALPPSIEMLGGALFQNCTNLTWVSYEAGWDIGIIPDYAFHGCENLSSFGPEENGKVLIPEKVWLFREGAFKDCKKITEVSLPNDQDIYIQKEVFKGCSSLKRIDFPEKTRFEAASGDKRFIKFPWKLRRTELLSGRRLKRLRWSLLQKLSVRVAPALPIIPYPELMWVLFPRICFTAAAHSLSLMVLPVQMFQISETVLLQNVRLLREQ